MKIQDIKNGEKITFTADRIMIGNPVIGDYAFDLLRNR